MSKVTAPPQLSTLPQQSLEMIQKAAHVLLKYGFDGITNLQSLQQEVDALLQVFQQSLEVLSDHGFVENLNLLELSKTLDTMVSRATPAGAPRPPGMTSKGQVTDLMRKRQREQPTTWALPMRQWFNVLDHIASTELYSNLQKNQDRYVSMYDVNVHFVKQWTGGTGCGLSVLMTPGEGPTEATLMLSHAWAEDMQEMRIAVEESLRKEGLMEKDKLDEIQVWFCVFANYQPEDGAGPSIQEQLELKPFKSVISSLAVREGHGMCTIHTSQADLYTRLWCVHEVAEAKEHKVNRIFSAMSQQYADHIIERTRRLFECGCNEEDCSRGAGILCNSSAARCSRPEDEKELTTAILEQHPERGFAALDEIVQEFRLQQLPPLVASMCHLARLRNDKTTSEEMMDAVRDWQGFARHAEILQEAGITVSVTSDILPALLRRTAEDERDDQVRAEAVRALAELAKCLLLSAGEEAGNAVAVVTADIVPALLSRTAEDERKDQVRRAAVRALAEVQSLLLGAGKEAGNTVADVTSDIVLALLREASDDDGHVVRKAAVEALAGVAKSLLPSAGVEAGNLLAAVVLPAVVRRTGEDERYEVREAAVSALAEIAKSLLLNAGEEASNSVAVVTAQILPALLRRIVEDKDFFRSSAVRKAAVEASVEIANSLLLIAGEEAGKAVAIVTADILPALLRSNAEDEGRDELPCQLAADRYIVYAAAVSAMAEVAKSLLLSTREEAGNCMAVVTAEILPALLRRTTDKDFSVVRKAAVEALAEVARNLLSAGVEAIVQSKILPSLESRTDDDAELVSEAAKQALAELRT